MRGLDWVARKLFAVTTSPNRGTPRGRGTKKCIRGTPLLLLGEHEAGAEGMRRPQQAAYVHGLADALDADIEVATHGVLPPVNRP